MAININVKYNDGFLLNLILLNLSTLLLYHWRTRLNLMESYFVLAPDVFWQCFCLAVLKGFLEGLDAFIFFSKQYRMLRNLSENRSWTERDISKS